MGNMPVLRLMVVDKEWVMYSERRFAHNNDLTTILSVGVGRMVPCWVGWCQILQATTRPSQQYRILVREA